MLIDMKKTLIPILLAVAFAVSGCDFFRFVAGRPTSADIEAVKLEMEMQKLALEEARQKAVRDSIALVRKMEEDSLAALDTIKAHDIRRYSLAGFGGVKGETLPLRYYIAVGSFKTEDNARKFMVKVSEFGYSPQMVCFTRGSLYTVLICPAQRLSDCVASLQKARSFSFCPADAWILVNAQAE